MNEVDSVEQNTDLTLNSTIIRAAVRPRQEENGETDTDSKKPTDAKKRRVDKNNTSILLDSSTEIVRHVYTFLNLKETLVVRQTCSALNTGTDAFRYCHISCDAATSTGKYHWEQQKVLANLDNNDKLRAVLLNKSADKASGLLYDLVHQSESDNGEAVSILLEDKRSDVLACLLDEALIKGFSIMAAALQKDDFIRSQIKMCATCTVTIGCYLCANDVDGGGCKSVTHENEDDKRKFCRSCILRESLYCACCNYAICPACSLMSHYNRCDECHRVYCKDANDAFCNNNMHLCVKCNRNICTKCGVGDDDREEWCCERCS